MSTDTVSTSDAAPDARASGSSRKPGPNVTYRRRQGKFCRSLVIAVHGMGDHSRNDFVQNIAQLFAQHYARAKDLDGQLTRLPAGAWDNGTDQPHGDDVMGFYPVDVGTTEGAAYEKEVREHWLAKFGFAEVHWAHIARELEKKGHRLEEAKKWAGSVAERAIQRHHAQLRAAGQTSAATPGDSPLLAGTVVEEVAETIRILERLLGMARKAGFIDFNLPAILHAYLGDVQQVTEFMHQRRRIRREFLLRVQEAVKKCPTVEDIHIIAHSEGTVVAFLGLLHALRVPTRESLADDVRDFPNEPLLDYSWIYKVRSFTTIGSPIDKHLVLWPDMWFKYRNEGTDGKPTGDPAFWREMKPPINWHNYYDLADPVGFKLDTARQALADWTCKAFNFPTDLKGEWQSSHDHGFRRYPLPGKAHIDYFGDVALFGHIVRKSLQDPVPGDTSGPTGRMPGRFRGWCSSWLPFLIVGLIIGAGVFILQKALDVTAPVLAGEVNGSAISLSEKKASANCTAPAAGGLCQWQTEWGILGCTALLYGTTILARVLRMTRLRWRRPPPLGKADWWRVPCEFYLANSARFKALAAWLAGAWIFWLLPGRHALKLLPAGCCCGGDGTPDTCQARLFVIAISLVLVAVAWAADAIMAQLRKPPVAGLRLMILIGGPAIVTMFLMTGGPNVHPFAFLAAGAAFIYLWWFGTLLFDLAWVWKTYINTPTTFIDRLRPPRMKDQAP